MRRSYLCCLLVVAILGSTSRQLFSPSVGRQTPASALVWTPTTASALPAPGLAWAAPSMRRSGQPVAILPSVSPDATASTLACIAGVAALTATFLRSTTLRRPRAEAESAHANLYSRGKLPRRAVTQEAFRPRSMLPHNAAESVNQPAATPQKALMRAESVKPPQALQTIADFLDKSDMKKLDVALGKKLGLALLAVPAPAFANERDGWLGWTTDATEFAIKGIHDVLGPGSYGYAIILFTLFIKAITFPLNYQQIASSSKMSALQPKVKKLQEKYRNDPQTMNQKMGELYMGANVNPLSALLPTFAQLPILISLYKGLNYLAEEDQLEESFLWLPNLEGPTFGNRGMDWLTNGWHDGVPPLGWEDTLKFLSLPVILVATQKVSIELNKPPDAKSNPQQEQTYKILGYLPFILGLTSCSVPAGLSIYWIINNVLTTGTTLAIKKKVTAEMEEMELASANKPMRTEPDFSRGFGGKSAKVISQTKTDSGSTVTIRPPGATPQAQVMPTVANASTTALEPVDVTAEVVPASSEALSANQMKKKARTAKTVKKKKKKGR